MSWRNGEITVFVYVETESSELSKALHWSDKLTVVSRVAAQKNGLGSTGKPWHDHNPRTTEFRVRPMLIALVCIFLCFVALDPWKVLQPEKLPTSKTEATPGPPRPDFSRIMVKGRLRPITNAAVKEIRKDGLIFVSDDGLTKVLYRDLPPEFVHYYAHVANLRRERAEMAAAALVKNLGAKEAESKLAPLSPQPN